MVEDKEPVQQGSILNQLHQHTEDQFKTRWGWVDLAINVSKETNTSYFDLMDRSALEVITLAAYLQAKVEVIESRMKK